MSQINHNRRSKQRGYSLAEIMVASAIFTIVILAVLLLYDRSNQVFKQSSEASDMQQVTRVAFDKVVADIRMTGFDYDRDGTPFGALAAVWTKDTTYTAGMLVQPVNPNGHTYVCINGGISAATEPIWPTETNSQITDGAVTWQEDGTLQYQQPDEQIEFAGKSAITIRANFNYETATGECADATTPCENGREPKLQSTPFQVVTTANNEIVTYALKPVKWASGQSADQLVFFVDTAIPRAANPTDDGSESQITIDGVDLCTDGCLSPPYTLYRFTIQEDGTPDAGVPVAENIRSMSLRYFTTTSAAETDVIAEADLPNGDGQYDGADPYAALPERDTRASIRAVELTLVGMNAYPDYNYTHPTDTVAKNYRQFELKSLIVPRNIARRGMKEFSTEVPGTPQLVSVCAGSCNAVFATWKAPTTGGDVDSFAILYDTEPCSGGNLAPAGGFRFSEEVGLNLSGSIGRFIEPPGTYSFAVQAINKWGAKTSNCIGNINVVNKTKPAALTGLDATGNPVTARPSIANQVDLYFPPAVSNVSGQDGLTCSGSGNITQSTMPPAEKRYYEIYRGSTAEFQPGGAGVVQVLGADTIPQPVAAGDLMRWTDTTAANCTTYYYRIRVVDYCARDAAMNSPANQDQGRSDYFPDPDDDAIAGRAASNTKPMAPTLTLEKEDCDGASGNCKLTLSWNDVIKDVDGAAIAIDQYVFYSYKFDEAANDYVLTDKDTVSELKRTVEVQNTERWKFTVTALGCVESDPSNEIVYPCAFSAGEVKATISDVYGGTGTAADPYLVEGPTVDVTTGSDVNEIRVALFNASTGAQVGTTMTEAGPISNASFALPSTDDGEVVRVLVTAIDEKGCSSNADMYIIDQAAPACTLTDTGTKSSLITVGKDFVTFTLENVDATNALTLQQIVAKYTVTNQMKGLTSVSFNGGTAVAVNCTNSTAIVTAPSGQTIPANSSTYTVTLNMNAGNLSGDNPITSLCIVYRATTGDIVQCQIHPSAGTCTVPSGAACQ